MRKIWNGLQTHTRPKLHQSKMKKIDSSYACTALSRRVPVVLQPPPFPSGPMEDAHLVSALEESSPLKLEGGGLSPSSWDDEHPTWDFQSPPSCQVIQSIMEKLINTSNNLILSNNGRNHTLNNGEISSNKEIIVYMWNLDSKSQVLIR